MNKKLIFAIIILLSAASVLAGNTDTDIIYLSGHDADDPVRWDFKCSGGRNAGKWTHIDVPSCWEQQGFGEYTYGRFYLDKNARPSDETGEYKRSFTIPSDWSGMSVRIVFEGVMTDATVKINGKSAGPTHQGGFTSFNYDISRLLHYGRENIIEVYVKKESDNNSINAAERRADWWLFGGIYRPVYLEAMPQKHISKLLTDAKDDGTLNLRITTSSLPKGCTVEAEIEGHGPQTAALDKTTDHNVSFKFDNVKPWNPEQPFIYNMILTLKDRNGNILHRINQKIGFRTIEFIPQDGFYLNGTRLVMKGINRHCFYPESGRTTSKRKDLEDIKLIKGMNANAIRSHYPPDRHLLELCDSLGLLYFDELPGWQDPYDNIVGPRILKEMIEHDANHPSIFAWGNGNEGGFNYELLPLFESLDPQQRKVVHPWASRGGIDAHHYPAYQTGVGRLANGYQVFMPTEFLHSKYDKGGGASLDDFWQNWSGNPLFAGGFIWAYLDEGVMRSDKGGEIDTNGGNAPDGIVGPNREKEASWYAIRDIWSPLQISPVTLRHGRIPVLNIKNNSLFNNLEDYEMEYEVIDADLDTGESVLAQGKVTLREAQPGEAVNVKIGSEKDFLSGTYLRLKAFIGADTICEWSLPMQRAAEFMSSKSAAVGRTSAGIKPASVLPDSNIMLKANAIQVIFDSKTGLISKVLNGNREIPFNNGPLPVGMKMDLTGIKTEDNHNGKKVVAHYSGAVDSIVWTMSEDGILSMDAVLLNRKKGGKFVDDEIRNLGFSFSYPEAMCDGLTWIGKGPYRVWRNRQRGQIFGLWHKDYNNTVTGQPKNGKLIYPEFKGYHSNVYEARVESADTPFKVATTTDGLYLRMFTPEEPSSKINTQKTMENFPTGDISFLLEIPPISSYKPLSQLGPKAMPPNVRINKGDEGLKMNLQFDFNVNRNDSTEENPAMVFLTAGQSNTDGRVPANQFTSQIGKVNNCFWRFGSADKELTSGKFEPFTPADTTQRRFGRWAYDAQLYKNIGLRCRNPFYVVKWSMGGTSIDTLVNHKRGFYWCADSEWMNRMGSTRTGGKSLLLSLQETIEDAIDNQLSQLPQGYEIKAFIWHQGESDRDYGKNYYRNLRQVVEYIRNYLVKKTGNTRYYNLPFIFGSVSRINRQFSEDVYQGMKQLAEEDPNSHMIDVESAELLDDRLHFTARSAIDLGNRIFRLMLKEKIIE